MNKKRNQQEERDRVIVFRGEGRIIYFFDEVDEDSVCECIKLLDKLEIESRKKGITIVLNCGGGGCYDGLALYDRIRQCECAITIVGTGIIASMGLIIYLAADHRVITENARLLNHQVTVSDFDGRAIDFKIEGKEIDALNDAIQDIISERTGQTVKRLKSEILPGDHWITPEEGLNEGYVDEIIKHTRTYRKKVKKNP